MERNVGKCFSYNVLYECILELKMYLFWLYFVSVWVLLLWSIFFLWYLLHYQSVSLALKCFIAVVVFSLVWYIELKVMNLEIVQCLLVFESCEKYNALISWILFKLNFVCMCVLNKMLIHAFNIVTKVAKHLVWK